MRFFISMLLYIFISHQKSSITSKQIKDMMEKLHYNHYVIVYGGYEADSYDNKILKLKCNDLYEGLPEKVIRTFSYLVKDDMSKRYRFFCKLDDDMTINQIFGMRLLNRHYLGKINYAGQNNREWHFGKCSPGSKFKDVPYSGKYVNWCSGGRGYILSRKACLLIKDNDEYLDEIYEDLYIAKLLAKRQIYPSNLVNIYQYLISPDHS